MRETKSSSQFNISIDDRCIYNILYIKYNTSRGVFVYKTDCLWTVTDNGNLYWDARYSVEMAMCLKINEIIHFSSKSFWIRQNKSYKVYRFSYCVYVIICVIIFVQHVDNLLTLIAPRRVLRIFFFVFFFLRCV